VTDTNLRPAAAPSDATDDPDAAVAPRYRRSTRQRAAALALPAIFLGIIAVFTALRPDTFGTTANLQTILLTQSVPAIFAIAVLLPLVVGEMDLSVGATLGLGLIVVAGAPGALGLSAWQSVVLALVATTAVGALNGFLVAYVGVNALVATLAVGSVLGGLCLWFTNGAIIIEDFPVEIGWMSSTVSGIPVPLIVLLVIATLTWYFLEHTTTGRYFYALGGSKEASRLAGLNVRRLTLLAFAAAGLIVGLAGVVQASLLGAGNPSVGPGFLLPGFAAAFLGATTLKPGTFNVPGTLLAVFTVATGIVGLGLLGVPFFIEPIFSGTALLAALVAARYLHRTE
jgi:ribose transport system permease protein